MPVVKNAQLRFRLIDAALRNKHRSYPTLEDLRGLCEEKLFGTSHGQHISVSTIEKDLRELRQEYDAPIAFSKKHLGYYYTDDTFSLDLPVSEEEAESIKLAAHTLLQFSSIPLFENFGHAVKKILERVDVHSSHVSSEEAIQFETIPETKGSQWLQPLLKAIRDNCKVQLVYRRFDTEKDGSYLIHPYLLKEYRNRWYLIGKNEEKDKISTFGLERIMEVNVAEDTFLRDVDFDAENFFKNTIGITVLNDKVQTVKAEVDGLLAKYLITQPIHQSQKQEKKENGSFLFTWEVLLTYELKNQLLSFGSACRVLEPQSLVDEIREELKKSMENYR